MRFIPLQIAALLLIFMQSHALAGNPALDYPAKPGELVVKLAPGQLAKSKDSFKKIASDLGSHLGLKSAVTLKTLLTTDEFAVFKMAPGLTAKAEAALKTDSRVLYAEPNYIYHAYGNPPAEVKPDDAQFGALWGMKNTGQADDAGQVGTPGSDIHATSVWAEGITGSHNIKVAIIDTGIDYTHPDLKANVDATLGFNFVNNTADAKDDHNHGSHCAGTIGAVANNHVGVAGVNWNVTMIPVKFLDANGSGSLDGALQAVQYATKLKVNIMSNSWGGGPFTQTLFDAITAAKAAGILFVAAAGNDGSNNDGKPSYPSSYQIDNIVSVAATDNKDNIASFSNFGINSVHVAAPGVKILSTEKDGVYGVMSGTSMATPHVSGISALLLSANPSLTYAQIKDILIRSSDKVRVLSHKSQSGGRVNVYNAIHGIYPVATGPSESQWKDVPMAIESVHPYDNGKVYTFPVSVPNAKYIRIVFDSIDTEAGYDLVQVNQATGEQIESLSGTLNAYTTDYLEGDHATITLRTDPSVNKFGFKVTRVQAVY